MAEHTEYVVLTTTVETESDAHALAEKIVTARLAACVQVCPIQSTYRWKGEIEKCAEQLLLAKTKSVLAEPLAQFIRKNHTYELPEVAVLPIAGGLPEYLAWIGEECGE